MEFEEGNEENENVESNETREILLFVLIMLSTH